MKTLVEVDFKWMICTCMRYARRQAAMMKALKNVDFSSLLEIVRDTPSEKDARKKMATELGIEDMVAREIMDMPLSRWGSLDTGRELDYYTRVAEVLTPLVKEIYGMEN